MPVRITDIYNPLTFARREQEMQQELNRFISSGILVMDPRLNEQCGQGGNIGELPFFKPLGTEEPNYSDDDPNKKSTPKGLKGSKMVFRSTAQNQSWATMDLATELALEDPAGAISGRIGAYWATINERRIIASAMGVLADNVASNNGDMVHKVGNDATGDITPEQKVSGDAIIDTVQTMGDHGERLGVIAMHSVCFRTLEKLNLIDTIPDARGEINIKVYQEKRVIVDDSLVAIAGTNRPMYTTILFAAGAFAGGEGRVSNPSELWRDPDSGNGGGQSKLYSRRSDIAHPLGFTFKSTTVSGQSASLAELRLAANWGRAWERKSVPIAFLQSNG